MADTNVNTVKGSSRSVITLAGIQNSLELNLGMKPFYDTATTLNTLYNVYGTVTPNVQPTEQYFGIGIGGDTPTGVSNILNPVELSATNLNLYKQIPFRMVPVEQDLTGAERNTYRIRSIETYNGQEYACYYLKKIVLSDASVQFSKYDPNTQADQPYTIDSSQLRPTPPATPVDGAITNVTEEITASVNATLPILGSEVLEVINAKYGGDTRYARISEIGIYTGTDMQQSATNAAGVQFPYTEAIFARLSQHHVFLGKPFNSTDSVYTPIFKFTSANMCVAQNTVG